MVRRFSQLVEELKYRGTNTRAHTRTHTPTRTRMHAQLCDLSFWKKSRVKSVLLFIQLTRNNAFALCHSISWSHCTDSRLISVSTLTAKTHSRKQTHVGVTGSSESVIVIITFLVNWIARLPVPMPDMWISQHGCWRTQNSGVLRRVAW